MNSSQTARAILVAVWVVATLLLTSAQLRVVAGPQSRRKRYVVAWFACALVAGWLLSAMDRATGRGELLRIAANVALAATVSGLGLAAGEWWTQRPAWTRLGAAGRFLTLALIHALVVLLAAYPFT